MITGLELSSDKIQKTLNAMQSSRFEFILTGSRFFGSFKVNSDYDFFVQSSSNGDYECYSQGDLIDYLESLGFVKEPGESYYDNNTAYVYRLTAGTLTKNWIDVQIVYDAALKQKIQNKLKSYGYIIPRDKSSRTWMWNLCFIMME